MVRYFISYEDLLENNMVNKTVTLYSSSLFIKKKYKKGLVKFEHIHYYRDNNNSILNYVRKLNYNKKGLLMVELTKEEAEMFDELFVKKYEEIEENICKKIYDKDKENIKLINFRDLINFNEEELGKGTIVSLMPCISNKNYMYISADRSKLSREYNIIERRNMLLRESIGSDIYFHTNDEEMLERYKNNLTELKEVDFSTYEIVKNKLFILDSINNSDIIGFNSNNYYCLDVLSLNSTPVYIENIIDGFKLSTKEDNYNSKGYIINSMHLNNLLRNNSIEPLIKYINIYELDKGVYKKQNLEEYLKEKKILKYIRKN